MRKLYFLLTLLFALGCASGPDLATEYDELTADIQAGLDRSDAATRARLIHEGILVAKRHPGGFTLCMGEFPADSGAGCAETSIEGVRVVAALVDETTP